MKMESIIGLKRELDSINYFGCWEEKNDLIFPGFYGPSKFSED